MHHRFFLLVAALFLASLSCWATDPNRVLVLLKDPDIASQFRKALPRGNQVIAQEGPLVLVAAHELLTATSIETYRKLPGVIAVQRDQSAYALEDCPDCHPAPNTGVKKLESSVQAAKALAKPVTCKLAEICPANGKSRWWAQDAVDADLMKQRVSELMGPAGAAVTVPVAVVDTGFDRAQESAFDSIGGVKTKPGATITDAHPADGSKLYIPPEGRAKPLIGNPDSDEGGHGTMVSSVIAGKGKLGVASNISLSVYRVTEPGDSGSTSGAILDIAAYRACRENRDPEGLTIINMSWGSRADESGEERDEDGEVKKKLIEMFGKAGCLVVKAAGNDAFRKDYSEKLDDAYLRVAAIDPSRELADFSSSGEVAAPGANVYVVESSAMTRKASNPNRCDAARDAQFGQSRRFISGTSFAAPMTAAIASQVVRVLKTGDAFKKLAPPDRIIVLNRILKASMIDHSINALRAVEIASRWNKASLIADTSPGRLVELLDSPADPACSKDASSCRETPACDVKNACADEARKRIAVCPRVEGRVSKDLALTFLDSGDYEDAYRFASLARAGGDAKSSTEVTRAVVENYLNTRGFNWKPVKYEEKSRNRIIVTDMDLNFMKSQLSDYFADCAASKSCDKAALTAMLEGALNSVAVSASTGKGIDKKTGEDRGSRSTLDTVLAMIRSGRKLLGDAAVDSIISKYFAGATDWLRKTRRADGTPAGIGRPPEVYARILDALVSSEKDGTRASALYRKLEREYLTQLMSVNAYFRATTEEITFFGESFPTRASFDGMIQRNSDLIDKAVSENKLETLAPVQLFALFDGIEQNPAWELKSDQIALDVAGKIAANQGWGRESDPELFEQAMARLASSPDPVARRTLFQLISKSGNLTLLTYLSNRYSLKATLGTDTIFAKKDQKAIRYTDYPELDHSVMEQIAPRVALALMSATPEQLNDVSYTDIAGLRVAFEQLTGKSRLGAQPGASLTVPVPAAGPYHARFNPSATPLTTTLAMPAGGKMLDDLATWLIKLQGRSMNRSASASLITTVMDPKDAKAVAALGALPGWKQAASDVLADHAQHPGKYDAKAMDRLRDFVAATK